MKISYKTVGEIPSLDVLDSPENVVAYLKEKIDENPFQEQMWLICLNTQMKPIGRVLVGLGSLNETVVDFSAIFRHGILAGAFRITVAHNHPSGDCTPSDADRRVTRRLVECGEMLGMRVFDHVIIGDTYFSFRACGLIA